MAQIGEPQRIHEIEPAVEPWTVTMPEEPLEEPTQVPMEEPVHVEP